ncbi:MAG: methylmalonyl-CoA carboxyltransferase, partial [Acidimicrobiia bacterium]|nr:methylmalonyl-CoA carboxyltransferase [Acidimicrobiia bacterium]
LGHARVHTTNGAIDDAVPTEAEAFARTKRFLSYLPRNIDELPPRGEPTDDPDRRDESLLSVVPRNPRRVYKMRDIIASVFDREPERDPDATDDGAISGSSFFEIGRDWGRSVICGLARLDGWPVAVIAEDPYVYGGAWTADASAKVIRHLDMASTFHLPVVHLEDCPGFLIGKQSEDQATIRIGSRALAALGQCTSPFCCIVIRKAFGVAGASNRKPGSLHPRWSWPSGDWGSLPIEGGIEVAYRTELAGLEGEAFDAELAAIKERLNQYRSPFRASEVFEIDDVIDPRDSRPTLCRWANLVAPARTTGPSSFTYRP